MKAVLFAVATALVLLSGGAARAAGDQMTILPYPNDGTTTGTVTTAPSKRKDMRDMTPEERQQMWDSLTPEQKARIIERRKAAKARATKQQEWRDRTSVKPQGHAHSGAAPKTYESLSAQRQAKAKAAWEAMSVEEKKAFIEANKDKIRAGIEARRQQGAAQ